MLLKPIGGGGGASVHNDLSGLQGGVIGEFFHITAAELTDVQAIGGHISDTGNPHNVLASQIIDFSTEFDSNFSGKSTTDLSEGTNIYYTEVRVSANTDVAANSAHRTNTGLDQHTQYILADGTRAFSGAISGVSPTIPTHLTTKGYVDALFSGFIWQLPVIDKDLSTPPGSPTIGDRYIVGPTATGAWATHEEDVAEWNGSSWDFVTPVEGFASWVEDENMLYLFVTSWQLFGSVLEHQNLIGAGANTHLQIDNHIADTSIHFTEGSISHVNIQDIGTNSHAAIDSHIASILNPHATSLQKAYDISATVIINDTRGPFRLTNNRSSDTENLLRLQNIAGDPVFRVTGEGHIITPRSIYIGPDAPASQGQDGIGIGTLAANFGQSGDGIGIGDRSAEQDQGARGMGFGLKCAMTLQNPDAIGMGAETAELNQGAASLSLGCRGGRFNQGPNGIIFSSTGVEENETSAGHITIISSLASMKYNSTTDLFTFSKGIQSSGFQSNGNTALLGGLQQLVTIASAAAYSVLKTTSLIEFDTTLNSIVATLPAIISDPVDNGRRFTFFRQTSALNQVTLTPQAPSTFRGETTDIILGLKSDSLTLLAVGGNWFPIDRNTFAIAVIEQLTPGEVQLIPNVVPAVVTAFDTDLFETNGILDADFTSNNITVIHNETLSSGGDGFKIGFRIECDYANNQELLAQIYVDGNEVNIQDIRSSSNAFNTVLEAEGVLRVSSAPQSIDLRILGTSNTNATYEQCTLIVERVGK